MKSPENTNTTINLISNSSEEEETDAFDASPRSSNFEKMSSNSTLKPTTLKTSLSRRGSHEPPQCTDFPRRSSSIKTNFSSTLDVRAYDKNDTVNSVSCVSSENIESAYETVNFRLDSFGKILKFEIEQDELQVKHSTLCLDKISQQNLNLTSFAKSTSKSTTKSKPVHKVNITNLGISDHVEGQVTALKVFENQECHVWFTTDGWKTFQETIAVKMQSVPKDDGCELPGGKMSEQSSEKAVFSIQSNTGRGGFENSESNQLVLKTDKSGKSVPIKYKFDFIIPKLDQSGNVNDFDAIGRPFNVQFHPILRSNRVLYLDYDFKIYSIKLRPEFQVL